jgi:hypothetical protein
LTASSPSTAPSSTGLLNGVGTFPVRYPGQGKHVEADLTDQVLALINGSQGLPDLSDQLGQALDADRARQLPAST